MSDGRGPGGFGPHHPDEHMQDRDPDMFRLHQADQELDRHTRQLAEQIRRAGSGDKERREKMKQELTELVNKHFNVRQERRELELKRLEEQIDRLRKSVTTHKEKRDEAVQRRISQLTGDDDLDF